MRHWPATTVLMLMLSVILALPAQPQQKRFTQEQVQAMVRDGFGDESGAKLIEQRGIDFVPAEDFIRSLKAAGASEAFLKALRAAKPPESSAHTFGESNDGDLKFDPVSCLVTTVYMSTNNAYHVG